MRKKGTSPSRTAKPGVQRMKLSQSTVLLVEDEPMLLEMTSRWFEREGCRVLTAENGNLAYDAAISTVVDLIVTDIRMPCMDGISLLRKVKARGLYTPSIVFITSGSDISTRDACDLGIEATFSKPVVRQDLISAAEHILTEKEVLWRGPPRSEACTQLSLTFESLSSALGSGQIAFGRGGFCIASDCPLPEGPVRFVIDFGASSRNLCGHGRVRWSVPDERRIGVEITSLDEVSRDWVIRQTADAAIASFIPCTTTPAIPQHAGKSDREFFHELGNLLAVVIAYGEACQELLLPEDPIRNYVEQMRSCAQRAALLARQTNSLPPPPGAPVDEKLPTRISDQKAS